MRNMGLAILMLGLALASVSCKSSDKEDDEAVLAAAPTADEAGADLKPTAAPVAKDPCAAPPAPAICCEAITPSCNECRAKADQELDAWRAKCVKPVDVDKDCKGNPPVASCNADDADCRARAMNALMDWKTKCQGELDEVSCDKQPPVIMCCQAMIPSCEACKTRAARIVDEWQRRCR